MDLKDLENQRDKEITGFFWLGLQIAFIFGIPAFLAVLIGKKIASQTNSNTALTLCLIFSFFLSWIFVIFLYKKKSKKIQIIEKQIKKIKEGKNIL
jgi:uncharacterized BrkB/YihY/UPF0761 family membrane protein